MRSGARIRPPWSIGCCPRVAAERGLYRSAAWCRTSPRWSRVHGTPPTTRARNDRMPAAFTMELEDEEDLGPHAIGPPLLGETLDGGGVGQLGHCVRALHGETHLFVLRDVVDDAGAAKEDALRE